MQPDLTGLPRYGVKTLDDVIAAENRAGLARITCGWRKRHLEQDSVRRYWRDVHSPAISRRAGLYEYRHSPFDAVKDGFFGQLSEVLQSCPLNEQLHWQSDVRYLDEEQLGIFGSSPEATVKSHLLADIELLVDRSTTYRAVGDNAKTYCDRTANPIPEGLVKTPTYAIFFRQRTNEEGLRQAVGAVAADLTAASGVLRVRVNLFEVPDMEAEKKAGYPIKTHPPEQQYQAFIELVISPGTDAASLLTEQTRQACNADVLAIHAYSVPAVYTFVYRSKPTLVGLRGFAAYEAINAIGAENQKEPALLEWMYGAVVQGGPAGIAVA